MEINISEIIIGRVKYDPSSDGSIFDSDGNHIADARSWGRLQYYKDGIQRHDALAKFIADAINEKLERDQII